MSKWVIEAEGLGKRYRLGAHAGGEGSLRDALSDGLRQGLGRLLRRAPAPPAHPPFWALRDVSFDVQPGEVVGIIGRNGAGKSTLLKILSRITDPTCGWATIRGRVGSLLEVGTGFHPELSGRENIYLNGAVLGMSKREIDRKFDAIVDFAEIGAFLDTPVKRYSSGMYVRLAFAVAAHLEPEILIVDEVLAVGDAAFQKKCLGKMGDVAASGRTVLFVSHNLAAVRNLCARGFLLERGRLVHTGPIAEVTDAYQQQLLQLTDAPLDQRHDRAGEGSTRIVHVRIEAAEGGGVITTGCPLRVTVRYRGAATLKRPRFLVGIYDVSNTGLYLLDTDAGHSLPDELPAEGELVCRTEPINLTPGRCYVNVALQKGGAMIDYVTHATHFDIELGDRFGLRQMPGRDWVMCMVRHRWEFAAGRAA